MHSAATHLRLFPNSGQFPFKNIYTSEGFQLFLRMDKCGVGSAKPLCTTFCCFPSTCTVGGLVTSGQCEPVHVVKADLRSRVWMVERCIYTYSFHF